MFVEPWPVEVGLLHCLIFKSFVCKLTVTFARTDWLSLVLYGFGKNVLVKNLKQKPCQLKTSMLYTWSYSWLYRGRGRLYPPPPRKKRERQKRKEQVMMIAKIRSPSRRNSCDNTSTILEPESRKVKDKWELPAQLPDWNFRVWLVLVPISLG